MTCIAAIEDNGKVHMGCDSATTSGFDIQILTKSKIWLSHTQKKPILIGCSGSSRAAEIIQFLFTPPKHDDSDDIKYLVGEFSTALRTILKEHEILKKENEVVKNEGTMLIGYGGKIYSIWSNFSVISASNSYYAIGSGQDFALGSLYTTGDWSPSEQPLPIKTRLALALEAAARHNVSVAPPFKFLEA